MVKYGNTLMPTEKGISKPPENVYLVDEDRKPSVEYWRWFNRIFSNYPKIQTFDATITATGTIAAQSTGEENFTIGTVANVTTNDRLEVNKPSHTSGLGIGNARVVAVGTVGLTFVNVTTSAILPPSETYRFKVTRK